MSKKLEELLARRERYEGNVGALDFLIELEKNNGCVSRSLQSSELSAKNSNELRNPNTPFELDKVFSQGVISKNDPILHEELVSIIMPSYNNGTWLRRALNSALSQTSVNVEVIVVDDGSTDNSVFIAKEYAKSNKNVKLISLLRNFGCYYARNIGIINSTGQYITTLDSDDIMSPDRLIKQLNSLKGKEGAIACRCQQRRWSSNYDQPLSKLKPGENSLLWKREVLDNVGFYDTVKFSGDAEFRLRLQRTYGQESVIEVPEELYFLRTLQNSLTTSGKSQVFDLENGKLKVALSEQRKDYLESFTEWQKHNKPSSLGGKDGMHMSFPQRQRPFELKNEAQNASPSLGQKIIGSMASFPPRKETLRATLDVILPQLDFLNLYLNDYDEVPYFAEHPKINAILGREADGDLRDNGKFYNLPIEDSYIFTFDDDLLYPSNYVERMIYWIEALDRSCVVGVHGVTFPTDTFVELEQRVVSYFGAKHDGHFVDLIGTGTAAWHSSTITFKLDDFKTKGICDVWFASLAAQANVPLFCVQRPKRWVTEYHKYEDSLYKETLREPEKYFETFNKVLKPVLNGGAQRFLAETQLSSCYGETVLTAAGIELREAKQPHTAPPVETVRSIKYKKPETDKENAPTNSGCLNFHIIVNGWNCVDDVDACLQSIAYQHPGNFTTSVTLVDDGSTDGTLERLAGSSLLPNANLVAITENTGPAHARHVGISEVKDPNTIMVLLDLDDALSPLALKTVAKRYIENPNCLMTIGNWIDQNGKRNPQPFYSDDQINNQSIREVELFNATHLRTFRRKLYDAIDENDLKDQHGKWFETVTDVALMYPLIDQCWSHEIEFIDEPIYKYSRHHRNGTLARFGKAHKLERLAYLKSLPPKPRLNTN